VSFAAVAAGTGKAGISGTTTAAAAANEMQNTDVNTRMSFIVQGKGGWEE
jgi:hypothetical protein